MTRSSALPDSKEEVYIPLIAFERNDYNHIYVDKENKVHIMVPFSSGATLAGDNTCKTTRELSDFFSGSNSAAQVIERYIADLNFDLAVLAKYPQPSAKSLKIIQAKQARLHQLKAYQQFFIQLTYQDRNIDSNIPERMLSELKSSGTNCVNFTFSPSSSRTLRISEANSLFVVRRDGTTPLRTALMEFKIADIIKIAPIQKSPEEINKEIGEQVAKKYSKREISNEQDFNALKDLVLTEYKIIFPKASVQSINVSYKLLQETYCLEKQDPIKEWAMGILTCGTQYAGIDYGAEEKEKERKKSKTTTAAEEAFIAIAKMLQEFQSNGQSPDTMQLDQFNIAIQLLLATINAHYYELTDHWLNLAVPLDQMEHRSSARRNGLMKAIRNAIEMNDKIEDAVLKFINDYYKEFGMTQSIPEQDWPLIKETFNNHFLAFKGAVHYDHCAVILPNKKSGNFYSLRGRANRIVLPLPVYFRDSKEYKLEYKGIVSSSHVLENNQCIDDANLGINLTALLASRQNPTSFLVKILLGKFKEKRFALTLDQQAIHALKKSHYYTAIYSAIYHSLSRSEQKQLEKLWGERRSGHAEDCALSSINELNFQFINLDQAPDFKLLLHENSLQNAAKYQRQLMAGQKKPGDYFLQILKTEYSARKAAQHVEKVVDDDTEEEIKGHRTGVTHKFAVDPETEVKVASALTINPLLTPPRSQQKESKHRVEDDSLEDLIGKLSIAEFYALLAKTKKPLVSLGEVAIDGSDWNCQEAALLADMVPATDITIFSDAKSSTKIVESSIAVASSISLTYPQSRTGSNPDWQEVVVYSDEKGDPNQSNKHAVTYGAPILQNVSPGLELINFENFYSIYERRLLPSLMFLNQQAAQHKQRLILTLPALGVENFSGEFDKNYLKTMFVSVLRRLIEENAHCFTQYQCICLDLYEGLDQKADNNYILPPYSDDQAVFKVISSRSNPSHRQELTNLCKGIYSGRGAQYRPVSLTEGNGFSWLATSAATDEPNNDLAQHMTGLPGKKFADGRILPIAGKGQKTYADLMADKQFTTADPRDWMVLHDQQSQPGVAETKLIPVTELKLERDAKESKKAESDENTLSENRDLQEAVSLFSSLCAIYELRGIIPEKRAHLTSGKVTYYMNYSGKLLQSVIETRIQSNPLAAPLWQWCLRNNGASANAPIFIEKIKKIIDIRNRESKADMRASLDETLAKAYNLELDQANRYLDQVLHLYQIHQYQQKISGLVLEEIKQPESSLSRSSISTETKESKSPIPELSETSIDSVDLSTDNLETKEQKESSTPSNILDYLTNLAQTGKVVAINPEVLDLYYKILKEIVDNGDTQLQALVQLKFSRMDALAKIEKPEIDALNRWWTCRQIVKNTIQTYKRSLGFFNWYGAKRADQLAKEIITDNVQNMTPRLTEFLQTGKTDVDRSCWAALFSWNRASGTSQTSLRGQLIDQFVAEEKDETREQRINRVVTSHGAVRFKV